MPEPRYVYTLHNPKTGEQAMWMHQDDMEDPVVGSDIRSLLNQLEDWSDLGCRLPVRVVDGRVQVSIRGWRDEDGPWEVRRELVTEQPIGTADLKAVEMYREECADDQEDDDEAS